MSPQFESNSFPLSPFSSPNTMGSDAGEEKIAGSGLTAGFFDALPEGCIAHIISLTSPRDACRFCLVSSIFRSAADADAVWERFLPPGNLAAAAPSCSSKKNLFLSLCNNPVLVDGGTKSFSLEKVSGKTCFMLSARSLSIAWGDTPRYWRWVSLPDSRFEDAAELISVCWFEIRGRIDVAMLSPSTMFSANLVFKSTIGSYGFEHQPLQASIGLVGGEKSSRSVFLDSERGRRMRYQIVPRRHPLHIRNRLAEAETEAPNPSRPETGPDHPKERQDGWFEIELGNFFYDGEADGELEMSLSEVRAGDWKGGIIVQGIEIRPKKA